MASKSDETDHALAESMHRLQLRSGRSLERDPKLQTETRRTQSHSSERLSLETEPQKLDCTSVRFAEGSHSDTDHEMQAKIRDFEERFHLLDAIRGQDEVINSRLRHMEERLELLDRPTHHQQHASTRIADSIIAPKNFTGDTSKQDPEQYLTQFNKFAQYKCIPDKEKGQLLQLLCTDTAQDWIGNLPQMQLLNWPALEREFRAAFCKSEHLKYVDVQKLFQTPQGDDEKVDAYFIRMRKAARCLNLADEILLFAIIGGLKANVKQFCIQNAPQSLNDALRCARIAEASVTVDPTVALLEKVLNANAQNAIKQETAMKHLTEHLSALSLNPAVASTAERSPTAEPMRWQSSPSDQNRPSEQDFDRHSRPTFSRGRPMRPQQIQRQNYVQRNFNRRPTDENQKCDNCGYELHENPASCPARSDRCRSCTSLGHWARMCRTARRNPY